MSDSNKKDIDAALAELRHENQKLATKADQLLSRLGDQVNQHSPSGEAKPTPRSAEHYALYERRTILPSDYADHGGEVERWRGNGPHGDCSSGCRWARWLEGDLGADWCVCARPDGPRFGLLTFEHQAGPCFQPIEQRPARKKKT